MLDKIARRIAEDREFAQAIAVDLDGTLRMNGIRLDAHERAALQNFVLRYMSRKDVDLAALDPVDFAEPWIVISDS